jgi:hypothetical protein
MHVVLDCHWTHYPPTYLMGWNKQMARLFISSGQPCLRMDSIVSDKTSSLFAGLENANA